MIDKLSAAAKATGDVVAVSPAVTNKAGTVTIVNVVPKTAPQDKATSDLIKTLRNDIVPQATQGSDVKVYVGGLTAIFDDFAKVLTDKLPLFIGVIILLGCLLLMLAFRSIVVPLVAAAMNLLAAGAAFGLVTAVFQHGFLELDHRHRAAGTGRGIPAGDDAGDPVRALDGLPGVPGQPHARGVVAQRMTTSRRCASARPTRGA